MFNYISKKSRSLIALFLLLTIMGSFGGPIPTAHATGIPVVDVSSIAQEILILGESAIDAVASVEEVAQSLYEWAESFVLSALKKELVDSLSEKVVGYVGGGENKFVEDWDEFLNDATLRGASEISGDLGNVDFCDSFEDDILGALGATKNGGGGRTALNCTTDNSTDGWEGFAQTLEPQNNFLSSYVIAKSAQDQAAASAEKAAEAEAIAGGGFLSTKDSAGKITTPGSLIGGITTKAVGADYDFIVNAEQLSDLAGSLGNSLISELTTGDSGLSGVNVAQRKRNRRDRRDNQGNRIPANCNAFLVDIDGNSITEAQHRGNPDLADDPALLDACLESSTAEVGSDALIKSNAGTNIKKIKDKRAIAHENYKQAVDLEVEIIDKLRSFWTKRRDGTNFKRCTITVVPTDNNSASYWDENPPNPYWDTAPDVIQSNYRRTFQGENRRCTTAGERNLHNTLLDGIKTRRNTNKVSLEKLQDFKKKLNRSSDSKIQDLVDSFLVKSVEYITLPDFNDQGEPISGTGGELNPAYDPAFDINKADGDLISSQNLRDDVKTFHTVIFGLSEDD